MFKKHYILLFMVLAMACQKIETADPVPQITFKSFEYGTSADGFGFYSGRLTFSFIDGDGDIGLFPTDTLNPDSTFKFNLFLIPYSKSDTGYVRIDTVGKGVSYNYRIRHDKKMERVGQYKVLKGDISILIHYFEKRPFVTDTGRYAFYMVDRAGNQSNTELTTDIGF